jgi:hypothetical protein
MKVALAQMLVEPPKPSPEVLAQRSHDLSLYCFVSRFHSCRVWPCEFRV